jgi:hypothetical protein
MSQSHVAALMLISDLVRSVGRDAVTQRLIRQTTRANALAFVGF